MTFERDSLPLLEEALDVLAEGFRSLPDLEGAVDVEALRPVLREVAARMQDNFPYHHPLYVGQMLKPPHPVARLAYALSMWINPNNHALDGSRAGSAMEKEAVAHLARMVGWDTHLGHLTGGGTMANLEALWIAREERPGKTLLASEQAHYTHQRLAGVLGMPFRTVPVDARGRMKPDALRQELDRGDVGTVVATLGTTAFGAVDPLDAVLEILEGCDVRVHVDAAYGGYFTLADNLDARVRAAFDATGRADSVVIDPHKHGLQPYGCGCVLHRDPAVGRHYRHDSPYTYFSSDELHLGEISLECSRPGASAVSLWATQRLLPCEKGGAFARDLETCRESAQAIHAWLTAHDAFAPLFPPELDIVVWAVRTRSASEASEAARRIFRAAAEDDLHLALAKVPRALAAPALPWLRWDDETITCLRACAMKPEHRTHFGEIVTRLGHAVDDCLRRE